MITKDFRLKYACKRIVTYPFAFFLKKAVNEESLLAWDSAIVGACFSARSMEWRTSSGTGIECRLKLRRAIQMADSVKRTTASNSDGGVVVSVLRGSGWRGWTSGRVEGENFAVVVDSRRVAFA